MKVEQLSVKDLTLDPSNARKHDAKNIEAIKGSLKRFGQQKAIVIDKDGVVIAGNGTLEAARQLGWEKVAAVRSKLTGSDRTAYALADNRTTDLSIWDDDILGKQLHALYEDDYNIAEIGFDPGDFGVEEVDVNLKEPGERGDVKTMECPNCGVVIETPK